LLLYSVLFVSESTVKGFLEKIQNNNWIITMSNINRMKSEWYVQFRARFTKLTYVAERLDTKRLASHELIVNNVKEGKFEYFKFKNFIQ
jgi:hypothetical protein